MTFDIHPDENLMCCCGHTYGQHVVWGAEHPVGACPYIITVDGNRRRCECSEAHQPVNHHHDNSMKIELITVTVKAGKHVRTITV